MRRRASESKQTQTSKRSEKKTPKKTKEKEKCERQKREVESQCVITSREPVYLAQQMK